MRPRVLVAGVGNVFFADDGFGVAVARRLASGPPIPGTAVLDVGIRGLHLAYELLEAYDVVIIADVLSRGGAPGTLYVIEPDLDVEPGGHDAHSLDLPAVFATARALGAFLSRVLIVGCEPAELCERIGLSAPAGAAVEPAAELIRQIAAREQREPTGALERRPPA